MGGNNCDKRGILMPETLKIILAVLGISLLLYLAYSLYSMFITDTEIQKAEASLNNLEGIIKKMDIGQKDFLVENPKDWYIKSDIVGDDFKCKEDFTGTFIINYYCNELEKLKLCKSESCICFCDKANCSEKTVCKGFDIQIQINNDQREDDDSLTSTVTNIYSNTVKIKSPMTINILKDTNKVLISLK